MQVSCDRDFLKKWNIAFIDCFNWQSINQLIIKRDYFFRKIHMVAPWHPMFFVDKRERLLDKSQCFNTKSEIPIFGYVCVPDKYFSKLEKIKLLKENLLLHYITIENKSIKEIFDNYKSRIRSKIRSGFRKFKFIKLTESHQINKYEIEIRKLILNQHIRLNSPSPPYDLIKNLFDQKAIEIFLAIDSNQIEGFITMSTDKNIAHVSWTVKSNYCNDNNLSICLFQFCLQEAIKRKSKIFSLGTTSSPGLARFKEQIMAEKCILFKKQINYYINTSKFEYFKTNRNIINLTLMRVVIKFILFIFGVKGYEFFSKQIWKRFD